MKISSARPYTPPKWCQGRLLRPPPHGRLRLANLPTPLYRLETHCTHDKGDSSNNLFQTLKQYNISLFIKRDDSTGGVELGGNKLRKLEFLLADALAKQCNAIVTIGGEQSNHCRATAAAARMLGCEPHLILRSKRVGAAAASDNQNHVNPDTQNDLGCVGNLLMDRMVGSHIYTCTPGEYGRIGSDELVDRLCAHLQSSGTKRPYPIPVGGSNAIGSWGYIEAVHEMLSQWKVQSIENDDNHEAIPSLDHILFACGSGGTATGIALGTALAYGALEEDDAAASSTSSASSRPQVHAVGVCDNAEYFYNHSARIAVDMGLRLPEGTSADDFVRQHMTVHEGKGLGYAVSTVEELEFVADFARQTGIVLDPVYTGKALYNFMTFLDKSPESYRNQNVLFWHTGGALGLCDKTNELQTRLMQSTPCHRLDIYGKGLGIDISIPSSELN